MTDDTTALPPKTHNLPPIVAPVDTALLADLQSRYPEVPATLKDFEEALATYPAKLTLADEETAAALQDLLGKMKKTQSVWKAHRGSEKKPWDTLVKVVQNFFGKAEEKIDEHLEVWKPRYQAFLDLKEAENRRRAEAEAERQRAEAERARAEAAAAEERRLAAERAAEEARQRAELERQRAEEEARKRAEAEAAAERARAEEKRIAEEKRQREKAEKETNATNLRTIKAAMKEAEKLHTYAEAAEQTDEEAKKLDDMIRPGGTISALAAPVVQSVLLDDDQKADIEAVRTRLNELRAAQNDRFDAKERKRREKLAKEAAEREAKEAAERAAKRAEEEAAIAKARAEREAQEAAAEAAKLAAKNAKAGARAAEDAAREHAAEGKGAAREQRENEKEADRAANRGDRLTRKIENSTDADFNRTRGDLGTVGSTTGRWGHEIVDEAALRAVCGPLGEHFTEDALSGAVYRWMVAHRTAFTGERVEGALAGVVFVWERDVRIA